MDGQCVKYEHLMMICQCLYRSKDVVMFVHACSATRMYRDLLPPVVFLCTEQGGVGYGPWHHADGVRKTGEVVVLDLC